MPIDENGNREREAKPHIIREKGVLWLKMPDGRLHLMDQESTFELLSSCMRALQSGLRNDVYGRPPKTTSHNI